MQNQNDGNPGAAGFPAVRSGRRQFLRGLSIAAVAGTAAAGRAAACVDRTPAQTEGPFYPVRSQSDTDTDLTRVRGRPGQAKGEKIEIYGIVTDQNCNPVSGALVEIWQACASGRYNHPGDTSGLELDPDFQYWGRALTDESGAYFFRTIKPGSYPAGDNWIRPPHIHFKVQKRGYHGLTSQFYFAGESLNDRDLILGALPAADRAKVIVTLLEPDPARGIDVRHGRFDIGIRSV